MNTHSNVWVVIEQKADNSAKNVSLELLVQARKIADTLKQEVYAIIIGSSTETAIRQASEYGADKIINVCDNQYSDYNSEVFEQTLSQLAQKYQPNVILIGATGIGRDLAPRVASKLNTGLTADCTELAIDPDDLKVWWTRPAMGGNLMAVITSDTLPQMGTVRPGVFKKEKLAFNRLTNNKAEIITENITINSTEIKTKIIQKKLTAIKDIDLESADIIVAGGYGLKKAENFKLIKELAKVLDAEIACSRKVVEEGWLDRPYQVGQSGKTITPRVYFAIGISGAIQHAAGIKGSDTIIAINNDPDAPIFKIADYGIIGDLFEILPELTQKLKSKTKEENLELQ